MDGPLDNLYINIYIYIKKSLFIIKLIIPQLTLSFQSPLSLWLEEKIVRDVVKLERRFFCQQDMNLMKEKKGRGGVLNYGTE